MSETNKKKGYTRMAFFKSGKSASVDPAEQKDNNSAKGDVKKPIKAGGKSYDLYPWGQNNLLPNERIKLLRTNGDAQNLIEARADFLYGGGFGWFKHVNKNGVVHREPYFNAATLEYEEAYGMSDLSEVANQMCTSLIETGNIFVNRTLVDNKLPIYSIKDALVCRATLAQKAQVGTWLLSPDWANQQSVQKNTIPVPAFNLDNTKQAETLFQLRPPQTGQPYYASAQYWGEESVFWIEVMNFIAKSIGQTVKHNKNIAHICRVASSYFDQMVASQSIDTIDDSYDPEKAKEKVRDEFYGKVEKMIESEDGPRVIFDECDLDADGKLSGMIAFEEIKRSLNAQELREAYQTALLAFANASRILPGLAGVSDGKTLGGSGSELKVSANYQQFFRTPRERSIILRPFNRDVKKALSLPPNVFAGFHDILLVSDDKNPAGKENKTTQGGTNANPDDDATQRNG